jgi:hypothetical protein
MLKQACVASVQGSLYQAELKFANKLLADLISFILRIDFGLKDPFNQLHHKADRHAISLALGRNI